MIAYQQFGAFDIFLYSQGSLCLFCSDVYLFLCLIYYYVIIQLLLITQTIRVRLMLMSSHILV